jgi:hypothetical protein
MDNNDGAFHMLSMQEDIKRMFKVHNLTFQNQFNKKSSTITNKTMNSWETFEI